MVENGLCLMWLTALQGQDQDKSEGKESQMQLQERKRAFRELAFWWTAAICRQMSFSRESEVAEAFLLNWIRMCFLQI